MTAPFVKLSKPLSDISIMCRGCLAESGEMKNIYEWNLSDDYYKFTDVQVKRSEGMTELLCVACVEILMKCKNFKRQCQKSDLILRDIVKKKPPIVLPTENIIQVNEEPKQNTVSFVLQNNKLIIMINASDMGSQIKLPCPYKTSFECHESFIKKKNLHSHLMKTHHVSQEFCIELQYYCSYNSCSYYIDSGKNKFFSERKFLNQHYNKVHKSKIFACDICKSSFSTSTEFSRHLKDCNVTYLCQICNLEYKTNDRLLVHLMRKHPDLHAQYKNEKRAKKRTAETVTEVKKAKTETDRLAEYMFDSPKRSFATQTLNLEENIRNDVALPSWQTPGKGDYEAKTDEISTQTVFEDLLSLKSQTSEDDSELFFSETVSLSDIQTQTFPVEFGLSRSNKETITESQSPDMSIKETQTCYCLYDSPKMNFRLFDSISSSPSSSNFISTETQTSEVKVKTDVLLSFSSAETQTCFDEGLSKEAM